MKTVALCGNPNSGKTTIFNALTGSHQHVGNWPGVTVEKKEGKLKYNDEEYRIVDLPGTYSLTANSMDERIARDFLIKDNPDLIVVVVDQTNIERNMYLVTEIMEMQKNTLLVFNMSDELEKRQIKIDINSISKELGIPIVKTSANKKIGLEDLKKQIEGSLKSPQYPENLNYDESFENILSQINNIIEQEKNISEKSKRWVSLKLIEGDVEFREDISKDNLTQIDKLIAQLEKQNDDDASIIVSEKKYDFITKISGKYVKRKNLVNNTSDKIDKIITNRWLGIPIFLIIMFAIFTLTFTIGDVFNGMIDDGFASLGDLVSTKLPDNLLTNFIVNGLIGGVGSVLVFVPNIFLLFLFISFLGDIGYMSRAAFVMDKLMTKIGLHGKSFIPMILGFGCSIPAIMSTRTLESRKDRIITILVTPLMSCNARLPVYILIAGIFFPKHAGLVIFSLYLLGVILAIIMATIFNKTMFKKEESVFIMELPPYRLPSLKAILLEAGRRTMMFIKKAGTIIFGTVIVIWILATLPSGVEYASESSIIGHIGSVIAPIFKPLGFGFWQAGVSLIFGFLAKEIVIGTMGTIFGGEDVLTTVLPQYFNAASAYAFLVFTLIYTPCVATIGAIKQEIGAKWAWFSVIYTFVLAYVVSFIVYNIGLLFI
ncbi:ferrous iron transport protein B [Oceanotoga sp. DSM 15011]|jgi:ferrous iron transport protein B|uniref:Ferrous iron transport protein B n=1 Tax=Oceanotoga teriensis TaxID=515440 RepID=A0AA45C9A5_9BACT|nr:MULTISPECIES: ferrous iron transport protein B [Oceanotoga]MDN5342947.1 ferrous iron transport protein [Oceanotoga sp.]MDO7975322.1 ferrous iron transport protein B [Oceanotoga teriensis]PWJ96654.1 ferrous iron transport protein B [Oceanotoga teriensis]UYP00175.1 ferrous iron transport protein B [Oceanotoga sp. DSM 15011]